MQYQPLVVVPRLKIAAQLVPELRQPPWNHQLVVDVPVAVPLKAVLIVP